MTTKHLQSRPNIFAVEAVIQEDTCAQERERESERKRESKTERQRQEMIEREGVKERVLGRSCTLRITYACC